jgi:thiol:disulfide interchange protein
LAPSRCFRLRGSIIPRALPYPRTPAPAGCPSAPPGSTSCWHGRPVFVDVTADWCITGKLNERVALADRAVVAAFASNGVATLRADWTRQDPAIRRILEANGRAGVPLYLFYPRPGRPGERSAAIVLPQILTAATILHETQIQ